MADTLTPEAAAVVARLAPRLREIVDEHVGDLDPAADGPIGPGELSDLFWDRAREEAEAGGSLVAELDAIAVAFTPDSLFPRGGRPACSACHAKPVYMAGLCGSCFAVPA